MEKQKLHLTYELTTNILIQVVADFIYYRKS